MIKISIDGGTSFETPTIASAIDILRKLGGVAPAVDHQPVEGSFDQFWSVLPAQQQGFLKTLCTRKYLLSSDVKEAMNGKNLNGVFKSIYRAERISNYRVMVKQPFNRDGKVETHYSLRPDAAKHIEAILQGESSGTNSRN